MEEKTVAIVSTVMNKDAANLLYQLIGSSDDKDGEVIGVKDGTVKALLWTVKEYESNLVKISSKQYVIFVGDGITIDKYTHNIVPSYFEYGMRYGWIGRQAALNIDPLYPGLAFVPGEAGRFYKHYQDLREKLLGMPNIYKDIPDVIAGTNLNPINTKKYQYNCLAMEFYLNGLAKFLGE